MPVNDWQVGRSIRGCLLGGAIGDAAGTAFEGRPPGRYDWRGATWRLSDDTQLTLATCEAITEGPPLPDAIARALVRWHRERRFSGLGASTLKALRDLAAGVHWSLAGRGGERAAGNGVAMRIAPLAFCLDARQPADRAIIRDISRITHHSEEAYVGALAVVLALQGATSLEAIAALLPDSVVRDRLLKIAESPATIEEIASRHGASGWVAESVPLAISAAFSGLEFADMIGRLIDCGGDTDSNASIAGQIVGAKIGASRLPRDLVARIPERAMLDDIIERFCDTAS